MAQRKVVAKDVSIRLHSQLDSMEKKRSCLEKENEELRVRLQDLEVAKQVLQQEIDKVGSKYPNLAVWSQARERPKCSQ
ncbi:protein SOGA1 isoform X1 [Lates japonicus]|uniref:Protein SOGA1 isoform X1 n=1 Tax=Lates japonicus TaxID=270547 RepID=A0AAD3QW29_LATJO|nr:protein SOGA1 isoform X1 [Lates japonicus]